MVRKARDEYRRETSEDELRANARKRVVGAVRQGSRPQDVTDADDLAWAFKGHEHELAELDRAYDEHVRRKQRTRDRGHQNEALARATDRVLAEWDARRRREAEAEARRRLGWPDTGYPAADDDTAEGDPAEPATDTLAWIQAEQERARQREAELAEQEARPPRKQFRVEMF